MTVSVTLTTYVTVLFHSHGEASLVNSASKTSTKLWEDFTNQRDIAATDGSKSQQQRQQSRRFYNFDQAGLKPIKGTARSPIFPNAIPSHRQIPSKRVEDFQYHLQKRTNTTTLSILGEKTRKNGWIHYENGQFNWNHDYWTDSRGLYLYYPTLLPIRNTGNDPDHAAVCPEHLWK